jgi:rhamnogalacturonyl hydrolase YesR
LSDQILHSYNKLEAYCEKEEFKGYDPYDSLNSTFLRRIELVSKRPLFRLGWTQFFKRSPINFRKLAGVSKDYNPKALGLFLSGYCNLFRLTQEQKHLDKINFFSQKLINIKAPDWSGSCWGYNFDWQARAFFQPKNTPNVVVTTYVTNALLDAYEIIGDNYLLIHSRSACNFILKDLNRSHDENGNFAFSYSPLDKSTVFNASLLGSRLLSRVYSFTNERILIEEAKKSIAFCCDKQKDDGSWAYGTLPFHQWVDSFHTGYNLECIADYMKFAKDDSYTDHLQKGFDYYINTFFTKDGIPKYYNNSIYPIDIHSSSQLVITLAKLNKFHEHKILLDRVLNWTIKNMQSDQGYFYYQINKYFSSKIPYMRWAQAWMFIALTAYIKNCQLE